MKSKIILIIALTLFSISQMTLASPVIDGFIDPLEGYTNSYSVFFNGVSDHLSGRVLTYQDGQILSVAVIQSLGLVDNSYSPKIEGKGNGIGTSGWGHKTHTLRDLTSSDNARFQILGSNNSTVTMDFTIDYFSSIEDNKNITGYVHSGVNGKDGNITAGSVLETATSMGYNYSRFGSNSTYFPVNLDNSTMEQTAASPYANYIVDDNSGNPIYRYENSTEPGWVYESIYEFKVDLKDNTLFDIDRLLIADIHNSPYKIDIKGGLSSSSYETIPEPAALCLGLIGMGMLRWRHRQKMLCQAR